MSEPSNRFVVSGPILVGNAKSVERAGREAIEAGKYGIDLSGVTEADSSGVAVLLSWLRFARERGEQVSVQNLPGNIRSLAAVYGVDDLLPKS